MKVINELHQLIRENYDKIAEMPEKFGSFEKSQCIADTWFIILYKTNKCKIVVYHGNANMDESISSLPFNEKLWTDFYNELKEVLNA